MRPVKLRHFTPDEFARPTGDWYQHMSAGHLVRIDILRDWWGAPISTSGHRDAVGREDDSNSYHNIRKHGIVRACDYRPSGIKTVSEARRFFLLAQQVGFKGIGFYPDWSTPGFHLDDRPENHLSTWGGLLVQQPDGRHTTEYVSIEHAFEHCRRLTNG